MSSFILKVGSNEVTINGTGAFVEHMQSIMLGALRDAPLGAAAPPQAKKSTARVGKNRGGRKKGSRVIGGKVYTAEQIRARPDLQKRLKKAR